MKYEDLIKQPDYTGDTLSDMIAFKTEFDEAIQRVRLLVEGADENFLPRHRSEAFLDALDVTLHDEALVTKEDIEEARNQDAIENDNGLDDDIHPSWSK